MFRVYYTRTPSFVLLSGEIQTLQMINTIMIFWCLSLICFICSESSQELEGKLLEYNEMLEKQVNEDALAGLFEKEMRRKDFVARWDGEELGVTMTFGLTEFLQKEGIDGTLKAADERLYQGKQEGRNRIIY